MPVAEGVALHAVEWRGDGAPVVLVHGLGSNLRMWEGVARALAARGHHVVAVDLRGHGLSDAPDDRYDLASVAGDVHRIVDGLGLSRPLVAGQSWGGNVVLELAWRAPRSVRGIACVDGGWIDLQGRFPDWPSCREALTPPAVDGTPVADIEAWHRRHHPDWPETGVVGALACYRVRPDGTVRRRCAVPHHLDALRGLWDVRPGDRYAGVEVPVLLVPAGPGDDRSRREVAAAEAGLPRSTTVWVEGDHDLHAQQPAVVARLLSEAAC